jgi:hypothetical protein
MDSGTHDMDDDDISVMMRGASDLKNTRLQLEDQVCALVLLPLMTVLSLVH